MGDKYSLSILNRHDDGTATSAIWAITAAESLQVQALLDRSADVDGLITEDQAKEATRVTKTWLAHSNNEGFPPE